MRMIALRLIVVVSVVSTNIHAGEAENRARGTLSDMQSIGTVIESYRVDAGGVPAAETVEALRPLLTPTYIVDLPVRDGWGTPFRYIRTGEQSFQIISAGADKKFDQKTWNTYAESKDLNADAVYVTATTEPGGFQRRWTNEAGKPLADKNWAETQRRLQPSLDAAMQTMKGMTTEQSFSQFRTSSTTGTMGALKYALESYKEKHGVYPRAMSMSELETALVPQFTSGISRKDLWGTELRYVVSNDGKTYRLISAGADETFDESSWNRRGALASADDDAVIENGVFVRAWNGRTQPGLTPRQRLPARARALLDEADKLKEAGNGAGALRAYMDAVKIDPAAAELSAIRGYANASADSPELKQANIAALRQHLHLRPGDMDATYDLALVLPLSEAEVLLGEVIKKRPGDADLYKVRGMARYRAERDVAALDDYEKVSALKPGDAGDALVVGMSAAYALERPTKRTAAEKRELIRRGLAALDRVEALRPADAQTVAYRSKILRQKATLETDPAARKKLADEADAMEQRALEMIEATKQAARAKRAAAAPPPKKADVPPAPKKAADAPAPTKPAAPPAPTTLAPLRIAPGTNIKAPVVIERVEPVVPDVAKKARISGIVILEALIDKNGTVHEANVLKPLPFGLDLAAVEAVKQWKFRPATRDGIPVDVYFNLTVNFKAPTSVASP